MSPEVLVGRAAPEVGGVAPEVGWAAPVSGGVAPEVGRVAPPGAEQHWRPFYEMLSDGDEGRDNSTTPGPRRGGGRHVLVDKKEEK